MSKKRIALDFGQYPPRWIKDQDVIEEKKDRADFIVNPKMTSKMRKSNPSYWKLENGSILVMEEKEISKKIRKLDAKRTKVEKAKRKKDACELNRLAAIRSRYAFAAYLALFISGCLLGLELYKHKVEVLELYNIVQDELRRLYVSLSSK